MSNMLLDISFKQAVESKELFDCHRGNWHFTMMLAMIKALPPHIVSSVNASGKRLQMKNH